MECTWKMRPKFCTSLTKQFPAKNVEHIWLEVLTAVTMKMAVFWVVAPCRQVWVYRRFRGLYCLHHLGDYTDPDAGPDDGGSTDFWIVGKLMPVLHGATIQKTASFNGVLVSRWFLTPITLSNSKTLLKPYVPFFRVKELRVLRMKTDRLIGRVRVPTAQMLHRCSLVSEPSKFNGALANCQVAQL
jgi:hypothetical protein